MQHLWKLAIGVVAIVTLGAWERNHSRAPGANDTAQDTSPALARVVDLPPLEGAPPGEPILVIAAQDCPEEAARRADRLAASLSAEGVRVARVHTISFRMEGPHADPGRLNAFLGGPLPAVVVRGRGMSNPSFAQVMAEYRGR